MPTRRTFVRTGLAATAVALIPTAGARESEARETSAPGPLASEDRASSARRPPDVPVRLGVASYSLRNLSRPRAIGVLRALRVTRVSVKSVHLAYDASPAEIARARAEFEAAGIEIVGAGLVPLDRDDEAELRAYFEYARAAGFPLMVISATRASLPRVERLVREYDIRVAVHNHGPEDPVFPSPSDALEAIEGMDPRVGLCVDVGHTARAGRNVVTEIAAAGARVLDVHMKDLADLSDRDSQCIVGEGAMPVAAIFSRLESMGYAGCVNLEYEIDADDPEPGMQRSFAYMRGVLDGLHLE